MKLMTAMLFSSLVEEMSDGFVNLKYLLYSIMSGSVL